VNVVESSNLLSTILKLCDNLGHRRIYGKCVNASRGFEKVNPNNPGNETKSASCYQKIYTCAKPITRCQFCVTIISNRHCHLDKYFPCFSGGWRSKTREDSLVT
jgi:hypothetical protein